MPLVTFLHPKGRSGKVPLNTTLLDAAKELGFPSIMIAEAMPPAPRVVWRSSRAPSICRRSTSKNRTFWTGKRSASPGTASDARRRCWAMSW